MMNNLQLTDDQQSAYDEIKQFLSDPDDDFMFAQNKFITLSGAAGTGKSTLITILMKEFSKNLKIVLTAPTNKAVRVLNEMCAEQELMVDCKTIHSLFGLVVKQSKDKTILKQENQDKSIMYDLIVIDEASMISDSLLKEINTRLYMKKTILVGDPYQATPVESCDTKRGKISNVFKKFKTIELNQIIRQRDGHPIITISHLIKKCLDEKNYDSFDFSVFKTDHISPNGSIYHLNSSVIKDEFIKSTFMIDECQKNVDHFRVISYTNFKTNVYNQMIRSKLHPNHKDYTIGETLLFRSPLIVNPDSEHPNVAFSIDSEAVIDCISDMQFNTKYGTIDAYRVGFFDDETGVTYNANVIKPYQRAEYANIFNLFLSNAKLKNKPNEWREYHEFSQLFVDVQPVYAITAHRSQGSTFNYCVIDLKDMMRNSNKKEMLHLIYVALTRAKFDVYVYI